jgi:hypothetical protein
MTVVKPPIRVQRRRFLRKWMDPRERALSEQILAAGWKAYCRACHWSGFGSSQEHAMKMGLKHLDLWHRPDTDDSIRSRMAD